jgi:hypothetical protein
MSKKVPSILPAMTFGLLKTIWLICWQQCYALWETQISKLKVIKIY